MPCGQGVPACEPGTLLLSKIRERIYLPELEVDHFVDEATQKLRNGYNKLQKENFRTDGFHSVVELML